MSYATPPETMGEFLGMLRDAEISGPDDLVSLMRDDYARREIASLIQFVINGPDADDFDQSEDEDW